jgi:hypothetical protein
MKQNFFRNFYSVKKKKIKKIKTNKQTNKKQKPTTTPTKKKKKKKRQQIIKQTKAKIPSPIKKKNLCPSTIHIDTRTSMMPYQSTIVIFIIMSI